MYKHQGCLYVMIDIRPQHYLTTLSPLNCLILSVLTSAFMYSTITAELTAVAPESTCFMTASESRLLSSVRNCCDLQWTILCCKHKLQELLTSHCLITLCQKATCAMLQGCNGAICTKLRGFDSNVTCCIRSILERSHKRKFCRYITARELVEGR